MASIDLAHHHRGSAVTMALEAASTSADTSEDAHHLMIIVGTLTFHTTITTECP